MNVVCGEGEAGGAGVAPVDAGMPLFIQKTGQPGQPGRLRDGGFDGDGPAAGGGLRLRPSGRVVPTDRRRAQTAGWQLPDGAEIVDEGGNGVAAVAGDGAAYRLIRQNLEPGAFRPGTVWRLTARMKGAGVQRGDVEWKSACLRWCLGLDGRTEYRSVNLPDGDWDWREVSVDVTVPERLEWMAVEAGLNGNAGRVWIDDIRLSEVK
jgi:hypothetical protein